MDNITKSNGVWKSSKEETDARKCHKNMTQRLPLLSENKDNYEECCQEWKFITGHKDPEKDDSGKIIKNEVCLCGMKIGTKYYFMNDKTKNTCVMGGVCCERINKTAHRQYIESLKEKGTCWLCNTNHKDLKTHYISKNHIKILESHMKLFKELYLPITLNIKINIQNDQKILEEKLKKFRRCVGEKCNEFVTKEEPEWKVRCVKCYMKYTKINQNKKQINVKRE